MRYVIWVGRLLMLAGSILGTAFFGYSFLEYFLARDDGFPGRPEA